MKKFEFTGETKRINTINGAVTLHRIKASVAFGNVKSGDMGGWIEKEENLSHDGDAWVAGEAWVYDNARVYDRARVSGDAWVADNARVFGKAQVSGDAWVHGNAWVAGEAQVAGKAWEIGRASCRERV